MRAWLHSVRVLVWKDLLQEWRSRDILTSMLAFAVLSLFIFNYALELSPLNRAEIAPGIVWVVMVFAGTLGLNRSFTAEQDQGCFEGLIMAVPDLSAIYFAKLLTNLLMMVFLAVLVIPIYSVLYNQSLFNWAFLACLRWGLGLQRGGHSDCQHDRANRMRDLLLPVLLFPLLLPVNMAVVKSCGVLLGSVAGQDINSWLNLLLVYDVIVTMLSIMVFEYVIKE